MPARGLGRVHKSFDMRFHGPVQSDGREQFKPLVVREVSTLDKQTGYPFPSARADTCSCSPEHLEATVAPIEERSVQLSISIQVCAGA